MHKCTAVECVILTFCIHCIMINLITECSTSDICYFFMVRKVESLSSVCLETYYYFQYILQTVLVLTCNGSPKHGPPNQRQTLSSFAILPPFSFPYSSPCDHYSILICYMSNFFQAMCITEFMLGHGFCEGLQSIYSGMQICDSASTFQTLL